MAPDFLKERRVKFWQQDLVTKYFWICPNDRLLLCEKEAVFLILCPTSSFNVPNGSVFQIPIKNTGEKILLAAHFPCNLAEKKQTVFLRRSES